MRPIVERAKLGDAKAIASLLNRSLSAKGITAQANLKDNCLRVMLESLSGASSIPGGAVCASGVT